MHVKISHAWLLKNELYGNSVSVRMHAIHNLEIRITDENNTQLDFNGSQWQVGLAFEVISGKTSVKKSVNRIESSDRTSDKKTRKRAR